MGIIQRSIDMAKRVIGGTETRSSFDSMSAGLPGLVGNLNQPRISVNTAMKFTAVYAAIRLRSNTIASLPKNVYDLSGNGRSLATDHPIFSLIKYAPNHYQNVFSFWNTMNTYLDGWGNAYAIIRRGAGATPTELIPVHPSMVSVVVQNKRKYYIVSDPEFYPGTYADEDMLHFFFYSIDGIKGVNPIIYNAASIATGIGSQEFGNDFFTSKGNIKAVIESDQMLTPEKVKTFQENFLESRKHGDPVLTHGFKYKSITMSPEAAQMLQTRTFALQDICRIFMVPPHLLGDLSRSTFSNIEHQDIEFVKHYVRPTVKMLEQELDRKLFFSDERGKMEIKFNLDGLLRGDMAARSNFYHNAILDGWMSRNEAREMEQLNPVDGLDEMLYPGNENIVGQPINNQKDSNI